MNLRKLRWAIVAYVIFDLYIGGNCGGLLPLNVASAAAQSVALLAQGQLGISCNAVVTATSANPGVAGGCTSLNLVTSGGALPGVYTWQVITTGSPSSLTVTFQGSLDGVTWTQLGTTSSAATTTTSSAAAYRFLGCIPSTLSGGTSPTVTCQISVTASPAGGSGTVSANSGSAGALANYAAAGGSTTVGPDSTFLDNGTRAVYSGTTGLQVPAGALATPSVALGGTVDGFDQFGTHQIGMASNGYLAANFNGSDGFDLNNATLLGWCGTAVGTCLTGQVTLSIPNGTTTAATRVLQVGGSSGSGQIAKVKASGYISAGTTFASSGGCTEGTLTGGATAGTFITSGTTSCSTTITMGDTATAAHGWACYCHDITTTGDANNCSAKSASATTATLTTGTIVSGDTIEFACIGY